MKIILTLTIVFAINDWDLLSSVELTRGKDPFTGQEIDVPVFNQKIKKAEGTVISLDGYVIPLKTNQQSNFFILSRYPYQSCFFCGAAGPETVVEVYAEKSISFSMDQRIKATGTLRLNPNDPLHLFYILEDAKVEEIR